MAVHTISILFPSYYSDFIHLSLNFVSYKLSKIFQAITINVIVFQCLKYCGKMPKFTLSKPNIIWILKVISTSLCHVRKTIKRNKHEQKGYTLKKRLFLTATSFQSLHVLQYGKGRKRESVQVFSPAGHRRKTRRDRGQRCIMGDMQMANSFHFNTGGPTQNYRQRNAFQIKDFV